MPPVDRAIDSSGFAGTSVRTNDMSGESVVGAAPAGWFDPLVAESYEMLYQGDRPYLFDSSKFARQFGFAGTPYADGIRNTAATFKAEARR